MDSRPPQHVLNQLYANDSWYIGNAPQLEQIFEPRIFFPIVGYAVLFQFLAYLTKCYLWCDATGFRQYRLRNITICFVHSSWCGVFVAYFAMTRFKFMVNNPVFYVEPWMDQILLMSIGYFIHDSIDMSKYELSRWSIELLFHHILTVIVIMIAVLSEFFVSYTYWALQMEINSFVLFRFVSPFVQLKYVFEHRHNFCLFYFIASFGSVFILSFINIFLFIRVLATDGYLGDYGRRHTAIGRDRELLQNSQTSQNGKTK